MSWGEDWVKALSEMPSIDKDREVTVETQRGANYSYKYATLSNVIETVRPILAAHNWSMVQEVRTEGGQVEVWTRFYHISEFELAFGPLRLPSGGNAQQTGSAITYARRYAITAALGLATEDDDDARSATQRYEEPTREDYPPDGADWLANAVKMFKEWDAKRAKTLAGEIAREIGAQKPIALDEAKKVHAKMAELYYQEFPGSEERPF